ASVDETIATVNASGIVTPIAAGTTAITVTTVDGNKTASCTVTVGTTPVAVTDITLNHSAYTLNKGDSNLVLIPFIAPADATNTNVTWTTGSAAVATVANGTVTAVGPGSTEIRATTQDGSKIAECTITVVTPVKGIDLDKATISGLVGDTEQSLAATISPAAANNKQVVWTSSDPAIASFIESAPGALTGKVRFLAPGTANITATTVDGGYADSCTVTVGVKVNSVSLSPATATLKVGETTLNLTPTVSPSSATNKTVTWTSNASSIATVLGGVVTPVAPGSATITAAPVFGTATATPGTSIIDVFNVTKGTMLKDDTLLLGKTVASVSFTIAGPKLPLSSISVTLNDGTPLQYHSLNGVYTYTGSTNTALAGVSSATVKIRNTISFDLSF
ncbi:MAG: Ig-like domain-containing protein, partial [Syntrophomonas sp.]